ncbi:MAG TPA: hypothetical protein VJ063_00605, partial [Verrucomicrobiae bacterium]|nr:hypothetical protein [Verrucomicrobiae bacterium]
MRFGCFSISRSKGQRIAGLFLSGFLLAQALMSLAREKPPQLLADDAATAWVEVDKVHEALTPPREWRSKPPTPEQMAQFQKQVRDAAFSFAGKAREFIARFPTNENIVDARITVVHALSHAVAAGDTNAESQIAGFVSGVLADETIPEDDRVKVLMFAGNVPLMKKVRMRLFTEGMNNLEDEFETMHIQSMRAALKQFPTNSLIYTFLVAVAQRSKAERQKELAAEIIGAPGAP